MKTFGFLSLLLMLCLATSQAKAATYVEAGGDVDREESVVRKFTLGGEGKQELKLTLSCKSNDAGRGKMRVFFYKRSPQGGWDQIDKLRIQINGSKKESSTTFKLSPAQYMVQIRVQRVNYSFKLEDAP